ncbi:2OG-Fe dioxygenase family protein [Luteimonas abyssi]|uniref:2OG-Fe dioxygenase family protein n=1 Tax=Luteimonas abyssi TaxID=1247514 RepID=UPI0009EB5FC2|nr:2OG-Fe dioxygenase family protein [Luteimonas abyssi]
MTQMLAPPLTALADVPGALAADGFAVLGPAAAAHLAGVDIAAFEAMRESWDRLPPDTYLMDGGRYRRRRHSCWEVSGGVLALAPHRAHWQPRDYNALHGGMRRWFEPVEPSVQALAGWQGLIVGLAGLADGLRGPRAWYVEAHQFRIDTSDGIGRPTPEGAHRDGVDLVAVCVVGRHAIKGGETRVFEADGPRGQRFTLAEPWSLLLLDDTRVIHESTPIQPLAGHGHRDTLVMTLRAGGFQGDD